MNKRVANVVYTNSKVGEILKSKFLNVLRLENKNSMFNGFRVGL